MWPAPGSARAAGAGAVEALPGCTDQAFPAVEDYSTPADLGFSVDFFGKRVDSVGVNENGNVTLDDLRTEFAPLDLTKASDIMIAPFLADVDVRGSGSVTYGTGTLSDGTTRYFCVDWSDVGYFNYRSDALDSFQLLLTQTPAQARTGDFTITFNYDGIAWDNAPDSGGAVAAVGFSAGDGGPGHAYMQPGSMIAGALLDDNLATGLVNHSLRSGQPGRYVFPVVNAPVPGARLHGSVYKSDYSTPGAYVPVTLCPLAGGPCTTRDTNYVGTWTAAGLAPGDYELTATPSSDVGAPASERVTVGCGDNPAPDLYLGPPSSTGASGRRSERLGAESPSRYDAAAVTTPTCAPAPGGGPPQGGGGRGPTAQSRPAATSGRQAIAASLSGQLRTLVRLARRRLAAGRRTFVLPVRAAVPGTIVARVGRGRTKVAGGRVTVDRAGIVPLKVTLTRKGRTLLRRHARVRLALTLSLIPRAQPAARVTRRFWVQRPR